jgi:hypothetical protein
LWQLHHICSCLCGANHWELQGKGKRENNMKVRGRLMLQLMNVVDQQQHIIAIVMVETNLLNGKYAYSTTHFLKESWHLVETSNDLSPRGKGFVADKQCNADSNYRIKIIQTAWF